MFLDTQNRDQLDYYKRLLKILGSLSNLFSKSSSPYLVPRLTETLFCRSFMAQDLSRSDVSADAMKENIGIGIKTFLDNNGRTLQKVAEFNKTKALYSGIPSLDEKIAKISELRNERIEVTKRAYGIDTMEYHCLTRKVGQILIFDLPMNLVDIRNIRSISQRENVITFTDGIEEYSFNESKSTLYKRFNTPGNAIIIPTEIISDPFEALERYLGQSFNELVFDPIKEEQEHIFLPLYSTRDGEVPERSGLNQWNAGGRERNSDEAYIPIPAWIHRIYPGFFPPRDTHFNLVLPDNSVMEAKVCQDNSKALMSRQNRDLGKWLLRDVLQLREGELVTKEKLDEIGLDSVVIYKEEPGVFSINFTRTGSYENFERNSLKSNE